MGEHELTQRNLMEWIAISVYLLNRNKIFWAKGYWWLNVGHLRQRQAKKVVVESRWAGAKGGQAWIDDSKWFPMYLVDVAGSYLLLAAPRRQNC